MLIDWSHAHFFFRGFCQVYVLFTPILMNNTMTSKEATLNVQWKDGTTDNTSENLFAPKHKFGRTSDTNRVLKSSLGKILNILYLNIKITQERNNATGKESEEVSNVFSVVCWTKEILWNSSSAQSIKSQQNNYTTSQKGNVVQLPKFLTCSSLFSRLHMPQT